MPAERLLRQTVAALDPEQRAAVLCDRHTVVLAGPGSGKTRTLVTKVAWALQEDLHPPVGVACLTFTRKAAGEFEDRLRRLGLRAGPRLFLGTAHAFCLTTVIPLHRRLAGLPPLADNAMLTSEECDRYLQQAADDTGAPHVADRAGRSVLRDRRRALLNGDDLTGRNPAEVAMARRYEELLAGDGRLDYDAMIIQGVTAVRSNPLLCEVLTAAYGWLVVDEYQDLTPAIHELVGRLTDLHADGNPGQALRKSARLFAVGDPDQGIFGFNGGRPDLLEALTTHPTVTTFRLHLNYRSGPLIIAAGAQALSLPTPRAYRCAPSVSQPGRITPIQVRGGYDEHVAAIVNDILPVLRGQGVPYEQVGILLQRQDYHPLWPQLTTALKQAGVRFACEAEDPWATTPISRWLREAATWSYSVSNAPPKQAGGTQPHFTPLAHGYLRLLDATEKRLDPRNPLTDQALLHEALTAALPNGRTDRPLIDWLNEVLTTTRLDQALTSPAAVRLGAHDVATLLSKASTLDPQRLPDTDGVLHLSAVVDTSGTLDRLTLTTFHKAKGREFDVVILPGLVESVTPYRRWNKAQRCYDEPSPTAMREERRAFYVALTRARHDVYLIAGPGFINDYGYWNPTGVSRFFTELLAVASTT
ncbi:ATP-dependent helicase [Micromonospora globbae]|uniref:ATP-dependent helicase n=1 Tax=Micromonospora globbae TaxID=1894969 RepID=UPI00342C4A75